MIPGKRASLVTRNATLVLSLLTVAAIFLLFLLPLDAGVRLAVMLASVILVAVLVFRDRAEQTKSEKDVTRLTAIINSSEDAIISKPPVFWPR